MGTFVKAWSPLLAALLVVLSVIYIGMTMRTHTQSIQERLTAVEKNIESIRNAIEGNQGVIVRIATLDMGCPNRRLAVDQCLDSRCQSRHSHSGWPSTFNAKGRIESRQLRSITFFIPC
jgi:hypothetical protein